MQHNNAVFLDWLKSEIPLLDHMELDALLYDGEQLSLSAPLKPNINDKGTGFGGSLATLATISGWCLTTLLLKERHYDCDVMIRDSQIRYLAPVFGDFSAHVALPDAIEVEQFLQRLHDKGKARLALTVSILCDNKVTLEMQGNYVAIQRIPLHHDSVG